MVVLVLRNMYYMFAMTVFWMTESNFIGNLSRILGAWASNELLSSL